ncbi:hypothetical protein BX070DRAFT_256914 [Coemansia spiralis]|nr:hypothetical protein BX070DRAFT_256914 [Coemansia spiralis]
MAAISELPNDILFYIFRYYRVEEEDEMEQWKRDLSLLAVCQRWRVHAIPLIYRYLFFESHKKGKGLVLNIQNLSEEDLADVKISSNIDLMSSNGFCHFARRLLLNMNYPLELSGFLENVLSILDKETISWSKILMLSAYLSSREPEPSTDMYFPEQRKLIANIAYKYIERIPNLTKLNIHKIQDSGLCILFAEILENKLIHQLIHIERYFAIQAGATMFSDKLRHLHVECLSLGSTQLSSINPQSLRYLCLSRIQQSFPWNTFCQSIDESCINFSNLAHLTIEFDWEESDTGVLAELRRIRLDRNYKFDFPVLRHLRLSVCPVSYWLLTTSSFPLIMNSFDLVFTNNGDYLYFSNLRFNCQERLAIANSFVDNNNNTMSFLKLASHLYGTPNRCEQSWLHLGRNITTVQLEQTRWTHLNRLYIHNHATFEMLQTILSCMPKLGYLDIDWFVMDGIMSEELPPELQEENWVGLKPCKAPIETLWIEYDAEYLPEAADAVVKYTMLKIPTLKEICIISSSIQHIKDFVIKYSAAYSHLLNINIKSF